MTERFSISFGALVRGREISAIKNYAHDNDITLKVEEDKHLLDSDYRLTVDAKDRAIEIQFRINVVNYIEARRIEIEKSYQELVQKPPKPGRKRLGLFRRGNPHS